VCVFDAPSPEAMRLHAYRAGLPVDEILAVADTFVTGREGGSECT
jgi:hypothetical protein